MGSFTWLRPEWLFGLAVPLALLVLSLLPSRPVEVATGALPLWQRLRGDAQGGRRRWRVPLELWCVLLALCAACLALARPAWQQGALVERWHVHLDVSPSMAWPWSPGDPRPRFEVACAALADWAAAREEEQGASLELVWHLPGERRVVTGTGAALPVAFDELLTQADGGYAAPEWPRLDVDGALWVTDAAPRPERAGRFASGGAAQPGAVGEEDGRYVLWTADDELTPGPAVPPGALVTVGDVPSPLRELAGVYAEERGLQVVPHQGSAPEGAPPRLVLAAPVAGADGSREAVGRDGWRALVSGLDPAWALDEAAGPGAEAAYRAPWLSTVDGRPLVAARLGRVTLGFTRVEPRDDGFGPGELGAAFAASWAGLFDAALRPAPGVVSVAERRAAGEPAVDLPAGEPERVSDVERREFAPWLGAVAALAAAAAAALVGRVR